MKCGICGKSIQETFLKKIVGTHVKDAKGKKHSACFECQQRLRSKEKLLEAMQ